MRKVASMLTAVLLMIIVSACGSGSSEKEVSLSQMIKTYQDAGIEVKTEEKPMFQAVGAKDGVIFYIDKEKVAIYEYESQKDAEKAKKDNESIMKDWPQKGSLVLESKNEQALKIFESAK